MNHTYKWSFSFVDEYVAKDIYRCEICAHTLVFLTSFPVDCIEHRDHVTTLHPETTIPIEEHSNSFPTVKMYTRESISFAIDKNREQLFFSYAVDRPKNWVVDQQTKDIVCLSVWLREELSRIGVDDHGRRTQENAFNRHSRSDSDVFELAAQIMNDALEDNIDRNRTPHRRWG